MKILSLKLLVILVLVTILIGGLGVVALVQVSGQRGFDTSASPDNGLVFIHHSVGAYWLEDGLHEALLAKDYIGGRNDITYAVDVLPDAGRPDPLAPLPGELTDTTHWMFWFNDYLESVKLNRHGFPGRLDRLITENLPFLTPYYHAVKREHTTNGFNRIIMFKSCYPVSQVESDGIEPGDPFSGTKTIANYKSVYRHPGGPDQTYTYGGYIYKPLEQIFAENPDVLFIAVTAPPLHYAPDDATTDENGHRARMFNSWLKNEWLPSYNTAHPGLNNVVVFDLFELLAYPDDHPDFPNRLRAEYGGDRGDSHPNEVANAMLTQVFASNPDNFIDPAWENFEANWVLAE